jgi:hypothetical protein
MRGTRGRTAGGEDFDEDAEASGKASRGRYNDFFDYVEFDESFGSAFVDIAGDQTSLEASNPIWMEADSCLHQHSLNARSSAS